MAQKSAPRLLPAVLMLAFVGGIYLTSNPQIRDQIINFSEESTTTSSSSVKPEVSPTETPIPSRELVLREQAQSTISVELGSSQTELVEADSAEENLREDDVNDSVSTVKSENSDTLGQLIIPKIELNHTAVDLPLVDGYWPVDELGSEVGLLGGTGRHPNDGMSMVFAGHVTTYWPINGPFAAVDELVPNDEIIYVYENREYIYKISRLLFAEPDQVNILLSDRGDQIILVTCGQYDYYRGSYDGRLVVLADLIEINPVNFSES
ncbi:MAG: sortase [Chloroflexota bacterium]